MASHSSSAAPASPHAAVEGSSSAPASRPPAPVTVQVNEPNESVQSAATGSNSTAQPVHTVGGADASSLSAAASWTKAWSPSAALDQAKTAMQQSESQHNPLHGRYRPLQLLEDDDSDEEWQGEARGVPSFVTAASSSALDAASIPLARSLLERERMASFLQSSWVFLLLLGTLASVTAWSVDAGVLLVTKLHTSFIELGGDWSLGYLFYILFRVFILLLGVGCTMMICPEAAGSGIPEMRSILGGFPFPNYLTGRALVAKCFGLVLALGSGLTIGKEGPFVHLSSIIAHQLLRLPLFEQIRKSKDLSHHVLAAACAVGVTATFGAPVGGVLFSIEVTTSYYVTSNYWRAFFSSVVGVVVFRALNSLLAGSYGSLFTTDFDALPYETFEIAFFLLLAVICGLFAALLVRSYRMILRQKKVFEEQYLLPWCGRFPGISPFIYAAMVAFLFSLVEYPVGSFMQLTQRQTIDDMFSTKTLTSDEVATATHLSVDFGSSWTSPSLILNLFAYVIVRFWALAISATVFVPSGIVTPVFAIGAALGRLFGEVVVILSEGELSIGGYAVVGAASFTAGVTGTISIAVIVFELTGQLSYMIPVLLCVIVGRAVTRFFSLDMYETMARQKNLPQWPDLTKQISYSLTAGDLMRDMPPYFLVRRQTLASIKHLLDVTNGGKKGKAVRLFPVVDDTKTMVLLGVATREELESLIVLWELSLRSRKVSEGRTSVAGIMPDQAIVLSNPATETTEVVDLVHLELLSLEDEHFHVPRDTFASHVILLISVHKCPQLFVTHRGKLQGVIHAADLLARSRKYML
ncbi:Chloride channel protein F [Phytophthora citrophthora]|uniref:Chloride channel protein F n=1 Tax=Phytophthora citrophthora TaxID=4793 RepID=A0AAD9LCB7_9STRA|nr:Chloride channel protein F [Phytophthora citrophthora]